MNNDLLKTAIKTGLDRNMIVYDCEEKEMEISYKLILLMKLCLTRNCEPKYKYHMDTLYISHDALQGIVDIPAKHLPKNIFESKNEATSIFNVCIYPVDGLGEGEELYEYYKNIQGVFPNKYNTFPMLDHEKKELVVGLSTYYSIIEEVVQNSEKVILGSV